MTWFSLDLSSWCAIIFFAIFFLNVRCFIRFRVFFCNYYKAHTHISYRGVIAVPIDWGRRSACGRLFMFLLALYDDHMSRKQYGAFLFQCFYSQGHCSTLVDHQQLKQEHHQFSHQRTHNDFILAPEYLNNMQKTDLFNVLTLKLISCITKQAFFFLLWKDELEKQAHVSCKCPPFSSDWWSDPNCRCTKMKKMQQAVQIF